MASSGCSKLGLIAQRNAMLKPANLVTSGSSRPSTRGFNVGSHDFNNVKKQQQQKKLKVYADVAQNRLTPGYSSWRTPPIEHWEGELCVEGTIPSWLDGVYLRNGPGQFEIGDHEFKHLFDGYATLVRLHFKEGKLRVAHAPLQSEAFKSAKRRGRPLFREFSETPKLNNLFSYFGELVSMASGTTLTDNANISVVRLGDRRVVCFTETIKGSIEINPDTLETLGKLEYDDKEGGILHTARPFVNDEELINLIPNFLNPGYTITRMEVGTNTRKVLGRVKCKGKTVGYVHSFSVTENYIVVPEISLKYSMVDILKKESGPYYKLDWEPHCEAFIHIVNKKTGKEIASLEVPPFVTFHFINAYEDVDEASGKVCVIVDCCEYMGKPTILENMNLDALRKKPNDTLPDSRLGRLIIPLDGTPRGELVRVVPHHYHGRGLDMPTINPLYTTHKYQYVYACGAHRPTHFLNMLTKVDVVNKTTLNWYEEGGIPSEPFFVPRPGATLEDDGVVLSIVSDNKGGSFVIVLDGPSFIELARAPLPHGLPYGFHGCWIPNDK